MNKTDLLTEIIRTLDVQWFPPVTIPGALVSDIQTVNEHSTILQNYMKKRVCNRRFSDVKFYPAAYYGLTWKYAHAIIKFYLEGLWHDSPVIPVAGPMLLC